MSTETEQVDIAGKRANANALMRQAQTYFVTSQFSTMNTIYYRRMARVSARAAAQEARVGGHHELAAFAEGCAEIAEGEGGGS